MMTDNERKLIFRKAEIQDLPKIVEIYNSVIPSRLVTADLEKISVESRVKWFHEHHEERPLLIAENSENETVGWLSFQDFYGRKAYEITAEISIYLNEKYRGKGYGKEILEYALQLAPKLEIENVLAFIFGQNKGSIALFEKFGFEKWGHFPGVAILDEKYTDLLILGKKV